MPEERSASSRSEIEFTVSWRTILKVLVAALLAFVAVRLWPLIELLVIALLIAITLFPLLQWTRRRRWPDWTGVLLCALLLFTAVVLFAAVLVPTVGNQAANLIKRLPDVQRDVIERLPASDMLRDAVNKALESASFSNPEPLMKQFLSWGSVVLKGVTELLIVLVVAVYLVADGERVYRWLLAFFPEKHRKKAATASVEIAGVVSSYMIGQLITSLLCGTYAFIILQLLHVPNAALLAVIAGVFDILPLIGFFLSIIPAMIVALSVSTVTALSVFVLYGAYHLVENYFIVPKVYGNRLRLSTLTVLVSCMAAGLLAGVIGAIAILPIVASYPIIERIWLKRRLEPDTVAKHEQIDAEEHPKA